ncbi:MAG TPA: DUF4912 domain-containing protein [Pirellulales bacterium]|nr:DUF4912 domain-containing protein [Pirellulales bacterium]
MTSTTLNNRSFKDLAQMAKRHGVHGWHAMRKDQLVAALMRSARSKAAKHKQARKAIASRSSATVAVNGSAKMDNGSAKMANGTSKPQASGTQIPLKNKRRFAAQQRLEQAKLNIDRSRNLTTHFNDKANGSGRDRLVVMVRGPFWLHACWELTRQGVERARAALGQEWHAAKPILRVLEVPAGATTSSAETPLRDIEIHGGVNNWYVDVHEPPKSYRLDIGYLAAGGQFYVLARGNVVSTPKAGSSDAIDENWSEVAENFDKIYAMSGGYAGEGRSVELQELFEERLRRPMGSPMVTRYGAGIEGLLPNKRPFHFEVDAELLVFGCTEPNAHVTLQGEPVTLRPDGSFTVRFNLPNCRQVIPAVSCSRDGFEQRTVVLAIERNTKTMEPLIRDGSEI